MKADRVCSWLGDQGRKAAQELRGFENNASRTVSPGLLGREGNLAIASELEAGRPQGRAQDVTGQSLDGRSVAGMHSLARMEVEGISSWRRVDVIVGSSCRLAEEPDHPLAPASTEEHDAAASPW